MNSKQEGSPVFGPLTNHKAVAVKCILGSQRNCQGAVLKTNHGGHQGGINNFTKKNITGSHVPPRNLFDSWQTQIKKTKGQQ